MNHDPIMTALAQRNPVREIPPYDEMSEARLRDLLTTCRMDTPRAGARFPVRTVAVGAGLAVALAAAVVVTNQPSTNHASTGPAHLAVAPPRTPGFPQADGSTPIDLIVNRSTIAMNSASDTILQGTETLRTPGLTEVTVDIQDQGDLENHRVQILDNAGKLLNDNITFHQGHIDTVRLFDYGTHQYQEKPFPESSKLHNMRNQAGNILSALRAGSDKVLGTSVIDGHTELHLSNDEPGMNRELWVDPSTYLPVRMTAHGSWGSYVFTYVWIPRTPKNVRSTFQPPIPAGFTRVPWTGA